MLSPPALLLSLAVSAQLQLPGRCVHPLWFSPSAASNCGQFTSPDSEAGAYLHLGVVSLFSTKLRFALCG